ncbi:MAG: phosphoglucosamine mutase [Rikenellaceae bacterium]
MTLIKSISGIRGTIGGETGSALTPIDTVKFTAAYSTRLKIRMGVKERYKVVVGRDARISGQMIDQLVCGTLLACGIDVVNAGLASTPTVEMAVIFENADGGIILTASHNPKQWNALKLLNEKGEFLDAGESELLLKTADAGKFNFSEVDYLGTITSKDFTNQHIEAVLAHPLVDTEAIYRAGFNIVLDSVNSVGGIIMPALLEALGVGCVKINSEPTGQFAHNPEPLPEHLTELSAKVIEERADMGISVDPDVDRLAFICEDGSPFGEEYTLVAVADYFLQNRKGSTVSNLSSSRALRDITESAGGTYYASPVGEINVVTEMKRVCAVIGGEGNGGVIVPDLHYGRDAMIGTALFLTLLANKKCTISELKRLYPIYFISKNKIELSQKIDADEILLEVQKIYKEHRITDIDGVKIDFDKERKWVHLRKSNTEPIIRIYAEAPAEETANELAKEVIERINQIINKI